MLRISRSRTYAGLVAGCTALALGVSGCGGSEKESSSGSGGATWASHEALVAAAKKEGKLNVITSLEEDVNEALVKGFTAKYPDIDLKISELENAEGQKFLLELQAGQVDYDSFHYSGDNNLDEWKPYMSDIDLGELADAGVVDIPKEAINPKSPNMMSAGTGLGVLAYNKKVISENELPATYEDFLDPKWKHKFMVQIDGDHFVELMQAWGKDKVLDYGRKIAAQDPVWTDSNTAGLTLMASGEVPMFLNTHYQSAFRLQSKQPEVIGIKFLDPIPGGYSHIEAIRKDTKSPASAVLFYEYLMTPEAQNYLYDIEPVTSSVYGEDSKQAATVAGRDLSILDWSTFANHAEWGKELAKAFGFPSNEVKKK